MNERTKALVRERAGHRCEYCQLPQDDSPLAVHHVEHIIPRFHGGTDDLGNFTSVGGLLFLEQTIVK